MTGRPAAPRGFRYIVKMSVAFWESWSSCLWVVLFLLPNINARDVGQMVVFFLKKISGVCFWRAAIHVWRDVLCLFLSPSRSQFSPIYSSVYLMHYSNRLEHQLGDANSSSRPELIVHDARYL